MRLCSHLRAAGENADVGIGRTTSVSPWLNVKTRVYGHLDVNAGVFVDDFAEFSRECGEGCLGRL